MQPQPALNIVVVGSLNLDIVMRTTRMPDAGETLSATQSSVQCGGKGANQATACAKLGASVVMIGAVGDDVIGDMLCDGLHRAGVVLTFVTRLARTQSGTAVVALTPDGENRILIAPGANASLGVAHIHAAESSFSTAQVLLCQLETPLATVRASLDLATRYRLTTILNAAPAAELDMNLLARVDILVVNETEARELCGVDPTDRTEAERAARLLQARGARFIVITLGARGATLLQGDRATHFAAVPADAVDTTAAGDTFAGALAAAIARGMLLVDAVRFGMRAAAFCVGHHGAQQAMPSLADLEGINACYAQL